VVAVGEPLTHDVRSRILSFGRPPALTDRYWNINR
jgi:hypothetical protein